ncbi:hypothetical protein ACLQ2P_13395 [Actinomadura citrea]|uniref:hypothetical protein n=1 Tax=Actinomadura citrea TaxID=46158 RepID=UPI003CE4B9B7
MSIINTAAVGNNRGASRWWGAIAVLIPSLVLLGSMFSQGVGGALTTSATVALASAALIVLVGAPFLGAYSGWTYRKHGLSMLRMGTRGEERTRIFESLGGGFTVDAAILRWVFVVVIGLTSLGINIGIAEADRSIGTGPRTAIMTLGTLLAGVTVYVVNRHWNQLVMRVVLLGGVVFAVALFSSDGQIELGGLVWAAVVGLHMFMVQKALTAFGTKAFDAETNKQLSQRYRDIGMTLANGITFFLILGYAGWKDALPTPDKFEGAPLPLWILYLAIPATVMVLPVLGMNWARNRLDEGGQAMLTSTAPVWGALAALMLASFGWVNPPTLDSAQWVGIGVVVLAALGAGLDASTRAKWEAERSQKNTELRLAWGEVEQANAERGDAIAKRDQAFGQVRVANAERDTAVRLHGEVETKLREETAERERLQAELDALKAEAQPSAANGAKSVTYIEATGLVGTPDGEIRLGFAGGLTVETGDGLVIEGKGVHGATVGSDGRFRGDRVARGTVTCGGREFQFRDGEAVQADPDGNYRIERVSYGSSTGAQSAE